MLLPAILHSSCAQLVESLGKCVGSIPKDRTVVL